MKKTWQTTLLVALGVLLFTACDHGLKENQNREPSQMIKNEQGEFESSISEKTISNKIIEYGYTLKGTIELPLSEHIYIFSHYLDLKREMLAHSDDEVSVKRLQAILKDPHLFQENFQASYHEFFPLLDERDDQEEKINSKAIKYWVSKQLKFTTIPLERAKKKVMLTIKEVQIDPQSIIIDHEKQLLTLQYTAECDGIRTIDSQEDSSHLKDGLMVKGDTIAVPKNIFTVYYHTIDDQNFFAKNLGRMKSLDFNDQELDNYFARIKDQQTATPCYEKGKYISPFNYFYYFDKQREGCKVSDDTMVNVLVEKVHSKAPDYSIYPEYHRLFADRKLSFFSYFNKVDDEAPRNVRALLRQLTSKEHGYKFINQGGDTFDAYFAKGEFKLEKRIVPVGSDDPTPIVFKLTIVLAENLKEEASKRFADAVASDEIVVYDGHAGHGANISEHFTIPEKYPANTYQIFFLNGCQTYFYGVSEILSSKALRDFDFFNLNIDLITTHSSSHMNWSMKLELIKTLEVAAKIYQTPPSLWSKKIKQDLSWYGIITRINDLDTADAYYLVSGEQNNDYQPGKKSFEQKLDTEINMNHIKNYIKNSNGNIKEKEKFLEYLISLIQEKSNSLEELLEKSQALCLELHDERLAILLQPQFTLPSCKAKRLKLYKNFTIPKPSHLQLAKGSTIYFNEDSTTPTQIILATDTALNGVTYAAKSTLYFYNNGQIESGKPATDTEIELASLGKLLFKGNQIIYFDENGHVIAGMIAREFLHEDLKLIADQKLIFNSDGTLSLKSERKGYLLVAKTLPTTLAGSNRELFIEKNSYVEYKADGKIYKIIFENPSNIFSIAFAAKTSMVLESYGNTSATICSSSNFQYKEVLLAAAAFQDKTPQNCAKFDKSGLLQAASLAEDYSFRGTTFLKNTPISFFSNGVVKSGWVIDGTTIDGIKYSNKTPISFYQSFKINKGTIYEEHCFADTLVIPAMSHITLLENGKLSDTTLSSDTTIAGLPLSKGYVQFHANGKIESGTLSENITYRELPLFASYVQLYEDGKIKQATLSRNTRIDTILYLATLPNTNDDEEYHDHPLEFFRSGKVISGTLAENTLIQGMLALANYSIMFFDDGTVKSTEIERVVEKKGGIIDACTGYISFYRQNLLRSCALRESVTANGTTYAPGMKITLNQQGEITSARL
ncbi:MAG: hypothetical protein HQK52_08305 [Oligoflexia bacterium]|nr:hypothetical protein [Oligoflexia bacterium]